MYRPEGWENPYQEEVNYAMEHDLAAPNHQLSAYEAGADAMLEGLKKDAISENHDEDDYIAIEILKGTGLKKGWLVFIPEE